MPAASLTEEQLREAGIGSFFRPSQLERLGISYDQLLGMVAVGIVQHVARGLYRLSAMEPTEQYSLAAACARVPKSVVCLLSALGVHGLGTQLPNEVWLAIPHKARAPRPAGVRLRIVRFSGPAWNHGIVDTQFEGVPARITSPARTIVDCFRFERLVGREAAMEALRDALQQKLVSRDALLSIQEILPSVPLREAVNVLTS